MKILFLNMLSVSFFTTVFIGLFCLICRMVNRRWISALTWTVGIFVGLRLLFFVPVPLPYTITFPEGMQMELPKTLLEQRREEYLEEKEKEKLEARDNGQKQAESVGAWLTRQTEALTEGNPGFPAGLFSAEALSEVLLSAAARIWFAVCLFLIVFRFAGYFRLRFLIFRKGKPLTEAENGIYRRCVNELRYGINIRVKRLAGISSPFGIGYFSQLIIIPEGLTDAAALENVFLHEIIHARRFDNWYRLLLVLAQSVHLFNPAVVLFFRKIERAREYLCDRAATEQRAPGERKAYCESILAVMEMTGENKARKRQNPFTNSWSGDKEDVKRRLTEILRADSRIRVGKIAAAPFLLLLLGLTCILAFFGPGISLIRLFFEGEGAYTEDIGDYGEFEGFRGYSRLYIFPETIPEGAQAEEYFYFYQDTLFDPSAQIYLECRYEDEAYEQELSRLSGIREVYRGESQAVRLDEERFAASAFVTIYGDNHCWEYALLLDGNRIAYVFLQFQEPKEIAFPAEYLPLHYGKETEGESFSIYLFDVGDGVRAGDF